MTNGICGIDFKRRSATRGERLMRDRGLKPTATIIGSLRDQPSRPPAHKGSFRRVAAHEGSRAFQRPDQATTGSARRVAAAELPDPNKAPQPRQDHPPEFQGTAQTRWKESTLGEIPGVIQTIPFGSHLHLSDYESEGLPVIMSQDIIDGRVNLQTAARISEQTAPRLGGGNCSLSGFSSLFPASRARI